MEEDIKDDNIYAPGSCVSRFFCELKNIFFKQDVCSLRVDFRTIISNTLGFLGFCDFKDLRLMMAIPIEEFRISHQNQRKN